MIYLFVPPQYVQLPEVLSTEFTEHSFSLTLPFPKLPMLSQFMSLQSVHSNETLYTMGAVETVWSDPMLLQVLWPCESLATDETNIVPVSLQVLVVLLAGMLLQFVPADKAEVTLVLCTLVSVLHGTVLSYPGCGGEEQSTEGAGQLLFLTGEPEG